MRVTPNEAALHERGDCDDRCPICRAEQREDR